MSENLITIPDEIKKMNAYIFDSKDFNDKIKTQLLELLQNISVAVVDFMTRIKNV